MRLLSTILGDNKEYDGTIVGKSIVHIVDFYIVKTGGRPFAPLYDFDCCLVSESCLKRK